jgi:reductive dehalogenase
MELTENIYLMLLPLFGGALVLFATTIISLIENEIIAFKRAGLYTLLNFVFIFILLSIDHNISIKLLLGINSLLLLLGVYIILPRKINLSQSEISEQNVQFDERDVLFKRRKLKEGTKNYNDYYGANPDKLILDNKWKKKPGLLEKGSTYFHKFHFALSNANFEACDQLIEIANSKKINPEQTDIIADDFTKKIKKYAKVIGAFDCGITELHKNHYYSKSGKPENYAEEIEANHKYAIAIITEMDFDIIKTAPDSPITLETSNRYFQIGGVAVRLAEFIRQLGYEAKAHIDGSYDVICPTVARDAGLGEIGRMGILINQKLGPRHRIAIVTTNIPLVPAVKKYDNSVWDFCTICKKCADNCPSQAISFEKMTIDNGLNRWKINHEKCFTYWCQAGTDCGKCISVCPYSHKNNIFHNAVRWMIYKFPNFRRVALFMDDLLYGRKPKKQKINL